MTIHMRNSERVAEGYQLGHVYGGDINRGIEFLLQQWMEADRYGIRKYFKEIYSTNIAFDIFGPYVGGIRSSYSYTNNENQQSVLE